MAISFVGSGVGTHAATSAQTYNFSSLLNSSGAAPTLAQGDIVYVVVENASTVNRGAGALVPAGYTAAHTANYQNDTYDSNFQVSYKVMGATPDTSVAIPASNATASGVAYAVYVFRGVNTTTPNSVTPVVTGGTNTGVANAPAITPNASDAGAWIVACGGAAVAAGAVFTNPAGMSTTTNHFRSTTITSTTNDANVGVALLTTWTSGAYDPAAFGGSTTTNTGSWSAVTLALKPFVPPVTGTFAATETGADTFAASGTVAWPAITGNLSATEAGADTFASNGDVFVKGSLAATESADTFSANGDVFVKGSLAATEGNDTFAGSGPGAVAPGVTGTLAATETGADTFAGAGDVIVKGSLAATETGADTFASTAKLIVKGGLAATESGADTFASTGDVFVKGALVATESGSDTFAAAGGAVRTGTMAALESADTFTASGKVVVKGSLAATETGADTFASTAKLIVKGSLTATETGTDTFSAASGPATSTGTMAALESPDTFTSSGDVFVRGALAATEAADDFASVGDVFVRGSLSVAEAGADTAALSGTVTNGFLITGTQAELLFKIYKLHGLWTQPLVVSATNRTVGDLVQSVSGTSTVTVATTAGDPGLSGNVGTMIEELAALHGITTDLVVTSTARTAGAITQTMTNDGVTTTVARV